ncbi:MAG: hypothetical protein U0807_00540 [Candidatus Binatia bacterium]
MSAPLVLFRCDAGPAVGLGHLARSAALARALGRAGARTALLTHASRVQAEPWLRGFDVVGPAGDVAATLAVARAAQALVVDGYDLVDAVYGADVAEPFVRVAIDDGPPRPLGVDLLVEPNLLSDGRGYALAEGAAVVAGAAHALLDPAFAAARVSSRPVPPQARRVLVTCGAADPAGMTDRWLDALAVCTRRYDVTVVVGPLDPRRDALLARAGREGLAVVTDAIAPAAVYAAADLALTTLGGTAAELACLGVPNLAVAVHPRQRPHLARYAEAGIVHAVGWHEDLTTAALAAAIDAAATDPLLRGRLAERGRSLVDGCGAERVAAALLARIAAG